LFLSYCRRRQSSSGPNDSHTVLFMTANGPLPCPSPSYQATAPSRTSPTRISSRRTRFARLICLSPPCCIMVYDHNTIVKITALCSWLVCSSATLPRASATESYHRPFITNSVPGGSRHVRVRLRAMACCSPLLASPDGPSLASACVSNHRDESFIDLPPRSSAIGFGRAPAPVSNRPSRSSWADYNNRFDLGPAVRRVLPTQRSLKVYPLSPEAARPSSVSTIHFLACFRGDYGDPESARSFVVWRQSDGTYEIRSLSGESDDLR